MVSLFFSNGTNLIHKVESSFEVGKLEFFFNVMVVYHVPLVDLSSQRFDLFRSKRRHSASARNAIFVSKCIHCDVSDEKAGNQSIIHRHDQTEEKPNP